MFVKHWACPVWAPSDGAGAGAAGDGEGQGGGTEPKWFENAAFGDDARNYLEAKGLTQVENPQEAISRLIGIGQAADKRFGRPVDSVIDKPKDGQSVAEWRRQNASAFGLPEAADGYKIERPKDLSDGIAWDGEMESQFRAIAFDRGLSQDDVAALTGLYAGQIGKMMEAADGEVARANTAMMADLEKTWGAGTEEKIAQARQAAQVIGEKAGMDSDSIQAVASVLTTKSGGDAATIRFFAALGAMMGEDLGKGFNTGGNSGMTAAEAKTKLDEMRGKGGAFFEAKTHAERDKLYPEIERLTRIAAGNA